MIKPHSPVCNLACDYCYYPPKQQLYPKSEFKMITELLAEVSLQLVAAQPGRDVTITWQGGEPILVGLAIFEKAVRQQKQLAPHGVRIVNALQTNGTLLIPARCRFFKENDFLIGLNLDGPPAAHNAYRHNRRGYERYDAILWAVRLMAQHGVDYNILCCVHQANVRQPLAVYRFLKNRAGIKHIQFIPILQRALDESGQELDELTPYSAKAEACSNFLAEIIDDLVQHDVGNIFIQHFEVALEIFAGRPPEPCIFAETCGRALALEHNGDLYNCDHYVEKAHLLGNITQKPLAHLVESEIQAEFGAYKLSTLPQTCQSCDVCFLCNGRCPKKPGWIRPEPPLSGFPDLFPSHQSPHAHDGCPIASTALPC